MSKKDTTVKEKLELVSEMIEYCNELAKQISTLMAEHKQCITQSGKLIELAKDQLKGYENSNLC